MDPEKLRELIKLFEESGLYELEISTPFRKIRLSRGPATIPSPPPAAVTSPPPSPEGPTPGAVTEEKEEERPPARLHVIKAPLVGTFYRAPYPGAPPFVEVGDTVKEGQTLCIIEAMKVMNEIKSDITGRVVQILVEDGRPVEYGQELFVLEPLE